MKNSFFVVFAFLLLIATPFAAHAEKLQLTDVFISVDAHYPKIKASLDKIEEARGKKQSAEGAFDARLDGDAKLRTQGFYDGNAIDTRIVKPLGPYNAEVYTGYRQSDGNFPIYDNRDITLSDGEARVGVVFSLLRNRAIDKDRFAILNADYAYQIATFENFLTQLEIRMKAQHAYAEWIGSGRILTIYQNLLSLAEVRQNNLVKQVKSGDVANIMLVENRQNIVKRRSLLNDAQRDFQQKTNNLSLFVRDKDSNPILVGKERLANDFNFQESDLGLYDEAYIDQLVSERPELIILSKAIEQEKASLAMGENSLLPKVDVGLETSKDMGTGPQSLDPTETIAKIKVSIPLQRELGRGKVRSARAAISRLSHEQRLLEDRLKVELKNMVADLDALKANIALSKQEVSLAKQMQQAEINLFKNGSSNLFLVNSREEKATEAEIKNILSRMYYFKAVGSFDVATMQLDKLKIDKNRLEKP